MINPLNDETLKFIYSIVIGNNLKEDLDSYLDYVGKDSTNTIKFIKEFVGKCKDFKIKCTLLNKELPAPEAMNLKLITTYTTIVVIVVEEAQDTP